MRISDLPKHIQADARARLHAQLAKQGRAKPRAPKVDVPAMELVEEITFSMPMPVSLTNASGKSRHFRAVEGEKKRYWRACDVWRGEGRIPPRPPLPYRRAWLKVTMYLGGAMDDDNATARAKWALDWLVKHRYILSDRRTCLRWAGIPEQHVSRSHEYRLVLTLSPREP